MNPSLFAALRIITMILRVDDDFDEKEALWFKKLIQSYALSPDQHQTIHHDLLHPIKEEAIEDLHAQITRPHDRDQLLEWAREAMMADGVVKNSEMRFYNRLKNLNVGAVVIPDEFQLDMALAVLEHEKNMQFWREMDEAGKYFSQRFRGRHFFRRGNLFAQGFSSGNRFIVGTLIVFVIVLFLIRLIRVRL